MNQSFDQQSSPHISRAVMIAMMAASAAVAGFAISTQSYWIDEAPSLIVAMAPDLAEAWRYAQAVGTSAIQSPVYNIYFFIWHKIAGGGEWAMRASNIPLIVFGQLAFLLLLRSRPRLALTASALALLCPMIWMYLDEARPYIMQYAAACWPTAALLRSSSPLSPSENWKSSELLLLALATVLLAGSSLLGILWTAGFVITLLWLWKNPVADVDAKKSPAGFYLGVLVLPLFALCVFYALTFAPSGDGYFRPGAGLMSLPYAAYEFFGFSGFGPGRLELRIAPLDALRAHAPTLLPLAAVIAILAAVFWQTRRTQQLGRRLPIAFAFGIALPAIIAVSWLFLTESRLMPRNFMPVLPTVILGLAALLIVALAQPSVVFRAAAVMFPLLWLCSSLNLRWRGAHAKDDYRAAAAVAVAALRDNKEVWWAADSATAFIYLTPVALEDVPGRAWAMQAPQWDDIRFKFPPRVIVISKPDIFDPHGAVARYAAENHFVPALKLTAFTILARESDSLPVVSP